MSDEQESAATGTPGDDRVRDALERARGGDPESLPAAREALDADPGIWRAYGDVGAHARRSWIELISGADLVLRESLNRKVAAMVAEIAGPAPSPLEVLLAERIGASWLQSSYADAAAARAGEWSVKQADFLRKRQDSASRRHLTAIAALATVRRLLGTAAGPAGRESKAASPATAAADGAGSNPVGMGLGDREPRPVEGDIPEGGMVLEFGPRARGAAEGDGSGRPGKSRVSSRS